MPLLRFTPGKSYFIVICLIGVSLFASFSGVLYRQFTEAQRTSEWAIHNYDILRVTRSLVIDLLNRETGVRGYLLTARKDFLEPYDNATTTISARTEELRKLVEDDPPSRELLTQLLQQLDELNVMMKEEVSAVQKAGKSAITPEMLEAQKRSMDQIRQMIGSFVRVQFIDLERKLAESRAKNKQFIYTLSVGTALAIGGMLLATLIILSLAARSRRAEEGLRERDERFLTVMNGVNDGLFDYNVEKKTIYYSPAYKAMLGYTDEEYPNTLDIFKSTLHPDDVDQVFENLRRYRNRESPAYNSVFRMRYKDGSWRWILSRGVGIWDRQGKMTQLIGTHTDITEQKNREEELKQLNDDLEGFTYITSHDLRSPLVNLKGFASEMEYALDQTEPVLRKVRPTLAAEEKALFEQSFDKDIPEALKFIKKSVEKMDVLTSAVLDLSRIGKREFHWEIVPTDAIVKRCLGSLAYEIAQKGVEVSCEDLPQVISDPVALEQVFGNLLDNAVKYLSPDRKGQIIIGSKMAGRDTIFFIRDNGRGIAPDDRSKIFEIFRRARNTGDVRGLGMGMAHVKATLRKLGGTIWFDSTVGEGTTFYFRLPANNDKLRR